MAETKLVTELSVADSASFDLLVAGYGNQLVGVSPANIAKRMAESFAWTQTDLIDVADAPWLNISPSDVAQPKNHVFIRQETADRTDSTTVQVQRIVTTDDGHTNPKAIRAFTQITAGGGDQIEWAISGEVTNSDNTRTGAEGGTAVSGVALKQAANTGIMFGGHFQVKDETGAATVGGIVGVEINIQANGADSNANRIGLDIIAKTYLAGTAGEFVAAIRIRNNAAVEGGKWTNGILVQDGNQTIMNGITLENSPGTGTGHGMSDTGSKAVGIILGGTYGSAAIRIASGQAVAMEATANIKMTYSSNIWGFFNGASERVGFDMTATPRVRVGGTAVLGARGTALPAAATDLATAITLVNDLRAKLTASSGSVVHPMFA